MNLKKKKKGNNLYKCFDKSTSLQLFDFVDHLHLCWFEIQKNWLLGKNLLCDYASSNI